MDLRELIEVLREEAGDERDRVKDARKIDKDSYGSGYDQGRLDGLLWVLELILLPPGGEAG